MNTTKWTVMAHNRVCSDATRIVEDDKAEQFLAENNPILNPDGSEWGQWQQVSLGGLSRQDAEAFCDTYAKIGKVDVAATQKHTPTPWTLTDPINWEDALGQHVGQQLKHGEYATMLLTHTGSSEAFANAEFILSACNAHGGLLEALAQCITQDGAHCMTRDNIELSEMAMRTRLNVISAIAKSAIAHAEGKE